MDLIAEIHLFRNEYQQALNVLLDENSSEPTILKRKIEICEGIIQQTKIFAPQAAASAALNIASWSAMLQDAQNVVFYCQEAVLYDPGRMQDVVSWLRRQAWDADSRKLFLATTTDILL